MSYLITFPDSKPERIVETNLMKETAGRTLALQPEGALIVWTGRQRLGKTKTAQWLQDAINEAQSPSEPRSFRATHYEVGKIRTSSGSETKLGIRSLYHHVIGPLDEGIYRRTPPEGLAQQLVFGIQKKRLGMIFVDEAGLLSMDAIGGMVLVRDVAVNSGYPLSLVFIGMDDLPAKLDRRPQIRGRVMEWCYFEPYNLEETWDLLAELHPHFSELDRNNLAHREQVEFVHETYGGVPGEIVPFLRKLDRRATAVSAPIDLRLLRAVHVSTSRDRKRALMDAQHGYAGSVPDATSTDSGDAPPAESRRRESTKAKGKGRARRSSNAGGRRNDA